MWGSGGINELSELGQPKGLEQNAAPGRVSQHRRKGFNEEKAESSSVFSTKQPPSFASENLLLPHNPTQKGHTFIGTHTHLEIT